MEARFTYFLQSGPRPDVSRILGAGNKGTVYLLSVRRSGPDVNGNLWRGRVAGETFAYFLQGKVELGVSGIPQQGGGAIHSLSVG